MKANKSLLKLEQYPIFLFVNNITFTCVYTNKFLRKEYNRMFKRAKNALVAWIKTKKKQLYKKLNYLHGNKMYAMVYMDTTKAQRGNIKK